MGKTVVNYAFQPKFLKQPTANRKKNRPVKLESTKEYMEEIFKSGKNLLGHNVPTAVIYELTAPSVPESARESAEQEEKLTVKQAKELAKAHKRLAELFHLVDFTQKDEFRTFGINVPPRGVDCFYWKQRFKNQPKTFPAP